MWSLSWTSGAEGSSFHHGMPTRSLLRKNSRAFPERLASSGHLLLFDLPIYCSRSMSTSTSTQHQRAALSLRAILPFSESQRHNSLHYRRTRPERRTVHVRLFHQLPTTFSLAHQELSACHTVAGVAWDAIHRRAVLHLLCCGLQRDPLTPSPGAASFAASCPPVHRRPAARRRGVGGWGRVS